MALAEFVEEGAELYTSSPRDRAWYRTGNILDGTLPILVKSQGMKNAVDDPRPFCVTVISM